MGRATAAAVLTLAVASLAIGACSGASIVPALRPTPVEETVLDAGPAVSQEEVSFRTSDGLVLEGVIFRPSEGRVNAPAKGVVLAHMFPADQESWSAFAGELAKRGHLVLTFNFRGYGDSDGPREIGKIDRDLEAALDFLLERGAQRAFLVGASMGGTAAVLVAARRPEAVAGLASLSGPRSFQGLDANSAASQVDLPALFIAAEGDGGALAAARWLAEAAAGVSGRALLMRVPGSDHGTRLLEGGQAGTVREALLAFLADPSGPVPGATAVTGTVM